MSVKLEILRSGRVIGEYDDLEHLKVVVALLDDSRKIVEFIAAILMALTLYRSGAKSGAFRLGSIRVRFKGGDEK